MIQFDSLNSEMKAKKQTNILGLFNAFTIEQFSFECRKTKTKPITYQLDYSANLKP